MADGHVHPHRIAPNATDDAMRGSLENSPADAGATGAAFDTWRDDPQYGSADWKTEVANDDTRLGYWAWVSAQRQSKVCRSTRSHRSMK